MRHLCFKEKSQMVKLRLLTKKKTFSLRIPPQPQIQCSVPPPRRRNRSASKQLALKRVLLIEIGLNQVSALQ
jgi:hypothetical protein